MVSGYDLNTFFLFAAHMLVPFSHDHLHDRDHDLDLVLAVLAVLAVADISLYLCLGPFRASTSRSKFRVTFIGTFNECKKRNNFQPLKFALTCPHSSPELYETGNMKIGLAYNGKVL